MNAAVVQQAIKHVAEEFGVFRPKNSGKTGSHWQVGGHVVQRTLTVMWLSGI
jgi:hypothetical protein